MSCLLVKNKEREKKTATLFLKPKPSVKARFIALAEYYGYAYSDMLELLVMLAEQEMAKNGDKFSQQEEK